MQILFQSTLSVRRATTKAQNKVDKIHISIHALREESDHVILKQQFMTDKFQSTLSVRRATRCQMSVQRSILYFNPRSP